jgi:hypothetical protein
MGTEAESDVRRRCWLHIAHPATGRSESYIATAWTQGAKDFCLFNCEQLQGHNKRKAQVAIRAAPGDDVSSACQAAGHGGLRNVPKGDWSGQTYSTQKRFAGVTCLTPGCDDSCR